MVEVWAEGLSVHAGLEDSQAACLVLIGALTHGQPMVLAVESGPRESQASWGAVRRGLRDRGVRPWRCTSADGPRGIGAALGEQPPTAAEPRCGNHRLPKVLDAMPNKPQAQARTRLWALPSAARQAACEELRDQVATRYSQLAPTAVERLTAAWERRVTFSQFPREHWRHLRTTNVVESPFAAVRRRTTAAKRCNKVASATAMIGKLLQVAEHTCRRLNAPELLPAVSAGATDADGITQIAGNHQEVAA